TRKCLIIILCIIRSVLIKQNLLTIIPRCQCVKTSKFVKIALIAQLKVHEPRPYCNRREVIVTLKNGSEQLKTSPKALKTTRLW
uniref:Chemokine interleukin-8-like domain-containing protein n=1 Tax=Neolamprologus brichardi TaxID=32507 RepID=A0A3Q4GNC1_NEOBR